ncbi:IS200/IS605 family accessory protein TnpB-related protein, partial [Faecalibaculum rodentium]
LEENGLSCHEGWKELFVRSRDRMMYLCGKNDEKNGNQLCHLFRMEDGSWMIGILPVLKPEKGQDKIITGPVKITHAPGLELLNKTFDGFEAAQPVKQAVSVRILRRKKGHYVQFYLHLPKPEGWSTSSFEGAIGLDFNADHIALCETDRSGSVVYARRISLHGFGRKKHNYDQGIAQMMSAVKEITGEARLKGKDLVIENLDFSGKKTDLQKNRDYNRMITQLAYGRYTQAVKRRCFKDNVDLKIVDPAYTSKKAKETVCRELGINVHLGAACMIARRGLGLF